MGSQKSDIDALGREDETVEAVFGGLTSEELASLLDVLKDPTEEYEVRLPFEIVRRLFELALIDKVRGHYKNPPDHIDLGEINLNELPQEIRAGIVWFRAQLASASEL